MINVIEGKRSVEDVGTCHSCTQHRSGPNGTTPEGATVHVIEYNRASDGNKNRLVLCDQCLEVWGANFSRVVNAMLPRRGR